MTRSLDRWQAKAPAPLLALWSAAIAHRTAPLPTQIDLFAFIMAFNQVPNGKAEMNANPIGNELQQINWAWPEADRATRLKLAERYVKNTRS